MIEIKSKNGNVICRIGINKKSKRRFELMKEDYILLKFSLGNPILFKFGDYIECDFGWFEVCDLQKPVYNNRTGGYDYELRLDAHYWKWKNKIFKFSPEYAGQEASWNLTASLDIHAGIVLRNLKALGYKYNGKDYTFSIDGTVENKSQLMSYENINILDACFEMAKKWDCECWVTDNIINFGRCEYNSAITFRLGDNVAEMSCSESKNTYATRIYAFGSSKNLPSNYRAADESVVVNGVVQRRLMLPKGTPYIDAFPDMTEEEAIEQVVIFDDIYPQRIGKITSVSTKEYTDEIENADGTTSEEKWMAYQFTDTGVTFDEAYILPGESLQITFQSGLLSGMVFDVKFDPNGKKEQLWEIVANEDYGRKLPDEILYPQKDDEYILSGFDATKLDKLGYISDAEKELKKAAEKYAEKAKIDPNTYTCVGMSTSAYSVDGVHKLLSAGDKVLLINPAYFGEKGRESRIIGFEFNLDYPFDSPVYTVGETASRSRIGDLEEKVESLTFKGQIYTGGIGNGVYVIGVNDNAIPTDRNVFSALRSINEFISKKRNDVAQGIISFLQGIKFGNYEAGTQGGMVDGDGNAEFLTAVIRELLRSTRFVDGMFGEGWQIWIDKLTGLSNLTIDKITVRQTLVAMELLIEKVRSVGGQLVVSAANGKIKTVTRDGDNYRITFEQENTFVAHDLMRCAVFTGTELRGYWVEVSEGDTEGITVPVREFGGTDPREGDECVLMGNTENPLRQNLISISATEDGQPRVDVLDGVSAKNFNGSLRCRLGNLDGIKDSAFPSNNQPHGNGLYGDNVYLKGTFILMTGEDILTRFEITEGKIQSAVEGLRSEVREEESFFDNTSFTDGMAGWISGYKAAFLTFGGKWILASNKLLSSSENGNVEVVKTGKVPYVRITNSYIMQKNVDFRTIPDFKELNGDGLRIPGYVYLSFHYKVVEAGHLHIEFVNADKTGFENFNMFAYDGDLPVGGEKAFNHSGLWNGTGDFKLSFTGVIQVSLLVFSTDRTDALAYKYATFFDQSEKMIRIAAANFDKDGNVLEASSIITTAKYNRLISVHFDENGELRNKSGLVTTANFSKLFAEGVDDNGLVKSADLKVYVKRDEFGDLVSGVTIRADQIELEGLVTANGYFKVLTDGSIETRNANISGIVKATSGKIGGFTIDSGRLVWKGYDYFGNDSRSLKLGVSEVSTEGVVDVSFGAATTGRFGVKAVGRTANSAAIYGSSQSVQSYPTGGTVWAGFFDGYIYADGYFTKSKKGNIKGGMNGAVRIDDSDTWFVYVNGICVGFRNAREYDATADE